MNNRGFDFAVKAMGALEMYREMYQSGPEYGHELSHVLNTLRMRAETLTVKTGSDFADKKFLMAFADALEVADKPGEYIPLSQRQG